MSELKISGAIGDFRVLGINIKYCFIVLLTLLFCEAKLTSSQDTESD